MTKKMKKGPTVIPAKAGIHTWYQCIATSDGSPIARLTALVEDDAGGTFLQYSTYNSFCRTFYRASDEPIKAPMLYQIESVIYQLEQSAFK